MTFIQNLLLWIELTEFIECGDPRDCDTSNDVSSTGTTYEFPLEDDEFVEKFPDVVV